MLLLFVSLMGIASGMVRGICNEGEAYKVGCSIFSKSTRLLLWVYSSGSLFALYTHTKHISNVFYQLLLFLVYIMFQYICNRLVSFLTSSNISTSSFTKASFAFLSFGYLLYALDIFSTQRPPYPLVFLAYNLVWEFLAVFHNRFNIVWLVTDIVMLLSAKKAGSITVTGLLGYCVVWVFPIYCSMKYKQLKYYSTWIIWWIQIICNFWMTVSLNDCHFIRYCSITVTYIGTFLYTLKFHECGATQKYLTVINLFGCLTLVVFHLILSLKCSVFHGPVNLSLSTEV